MMYKAMKCVSITLSLQSSKTLTWIINFLLPIVVEKNTIHRDSPSLQNFTSISLTSVAISTVVLYIGIVKVWGFLPKNPTYKLAKYLLYDSMAA